MITGELHGQKMAPIFQMGEAMPRVSKGRRTGQAAVNAVRTLFEDHDHIVQEISGHNDFGEDLYVTFTEDGTVSSDTIKVQVKGGKKYSRANGYAVSVGQHGETWTEGNVPVYVIVQDYRTNTLYWANATRQLRQAGLFNVPKYIGISPNAVLDGQSMPSFVALARSYAGRYRGRRAVLTHLSEMSGASFEPEDHVMHFVNSDDEDLIFWRQPGSDLATLILSAHDWEAFDVSVESLMYSTPLDLPPPNDLDRPRDGGGGYLPTADDLDLGSAEVMWAISCFIATQEADEGLEEVSDTTTSCTGCSNCAGENPTAHGYIDAEVADTYVLRRMIERVEAEPDLIEQSIRALRADTALSPDIIAELGPLESNSEIVRQVKRLGPQILNATDIADYNVLRLAMLYLIDRVYIGGESRDHIRIVWRVPEGPPSPPRFGGH